MISPSCQFSRQNPSMWHKERPNDFHIASPWLRHFSKVEINGLEISDGRRWAGKVNVRFLSGKSSVNVQHGCMVNNMVCVERCLQGQVPYPTISPTKKIMVLDLKIMVLYKVKHWDSKFIYRFWRSFQGPGTLRSPILMLRVARPAQAQLNLMLEAREAMVFHWQLFRAGTVFFIMLPNPKQMYLPSSSNLFWCSHWATGTCISLSKSLS